LLAFAQSTKGQASVLQFGDFVLQSAEGAQQGDPLAGRYIFAWPVLKSLDRRFQGFDASGLAYGSATLAGLPD